MRQQVPVCTGSGATALALQKKDHAPANTAQGKEGQPWLEISMKKNAAHRSEMKA